MASLESLHIGWMALSEKPTEEGHLVSTVPMNETVLGAAVLLGRDLDGGRHLLVPAPSEAVVSDDSSEAVRVQPLELGSGANRDTYVDVVCEEESLFDVFDDLIVVLMRELSETEDPGAVCAEVIVRWREMLRPGRQEPLSASQAAGLLAELLTAIRIVELDPQRRIDVWQGPTGARHDFRRGQDAVEVKATLSSSTTSASIHGLEQLERPANGSLHLVWLRLEQVVDGSLCVEREIQELRKLVASTEDMYKLLGEAGWAPGTESEKLKFELLETRMFEVTNDFPRLTPSSLTNTRHVADIEDVRYRVRLDGVPPVDDVAAEAVMSKLARGA